MDDGDRDLNSKSFPLLHPDDPDFTDINPPYSELDGDAPINIYPLLPSMELNLQSLSLIIMQPKSSASHSATVYSVYV